MGRRQVPGKGKDRRDPQTLAWSLPWGDDRATLETLVFSPAEVRWIFAHVFRGRQGKVRLYNETKLLVDYMDGLATGVSLTMHVVLPELLGKSFYAGVDISPGAKTFLEFVYVGEGDGFRCAEIIVGARRRVSVEQGSIITSSFPFPIPWRIALVLVVRAKLELVAAGGSTIESEFLAAIALPDGQTVLEMLGGAVSVAYTTGQMPRLTAGTVVVQGELEDPSP